MKLTKIQWFTLLLIAGYLVYEFIFVARWKAELPPSDPVIRADLIIILPLLLIFIVISLVQFVRRSKK